MVVCCSFIKPKVTALFSISILRPSFNQKLNPTSCGISDSVAATRGGRGISWKESFWTLYCYRTFVTRDIPKFRLKSQKLNEILIFEKFGI